MTSGDDWLRSIEAAESFLDSLAPSEPGYWMQQYLKIRTKTEGLKSWRFNRIQRILYQEVRKAWTESRPIRFLVPKSRQMGISTFVQGLIFERTFRIPNLSSAVIAHDEDGALNIFQMARTFYEELPEDMKLVRQVRYSGVKQLEFEAPHRSKYHVETIKSGDRLGKSYSHQMLHGSEAASWSDENNPANVAWRSIGQSVLRHSDTMCFLESTGKGRDPFFYQKCMRTLRPSYRGNWRVVFLPWYYHEEYYEEAGGSFARTSEEKDLADQVEDTNGWQVTDDQFQWRRMQIEDECEGEVSDFRRYYPSFLHECFEQHERKFFGRGVIEHYRRMVREPAAVGDIQGEFGETRPSFLPCDDGWLRIWEKPRSGEKYVLFSDVAEGGPQGDFDSAYVIWPKKARVVAAVHGSMDNDELANYLAMIGQWYNMALIGVENNNPEVSRRLWKELSYPQLYWDRDMAKAGKNRLFRPGWNTNKKSRQIMLAALKKLTRTKVLECFDEGFVLEMEDFIWSDTKKRPQAAEGRHDDRIMSMAGLVAISGLDIREKIKREKPKDEMSVYEIAMARRKKMKRKQRQMGRLSRRGSRRDGLTIG